MKQSLISLLALAVAPVLSSECEAITSWVTVTAEAVTLEASSQVSSTFALSITKASIRTTSTAVETSVASEKTTVTVPTSTVSTAAIVYETTAAVATIVSTTTSQAAVKETTVTAEAVGTTTTSVETSTKPVETSTKPVETSTKSVETSTKSLETSTSTSTSQAAASPTASASATSSSSSSSQSLGESVTGEATFYGGNIAGGTCSFTTYTLPANIFGTAFSGSAWNAAAHCGECVQVTGPNGNSITAMVVDQCPECDASHLDLFQNAFTELGTISAGIISTSYKFVSCPITSPMELHSKSGTSAFFFSMQVVNANEPVATLEVSTDGGSTWKATTRRDYNFFESSSGFGVETVSVRVTSASGGAVTVDGVSCASGAQVTASSNF